MWTGSCGPELGTGVRLGLAGASASATAGAVPDAASGSHGKAAGADTGSFPSLPVLCRLQFTAVCLPRLGLSRGRRGQYKRSGRTASVRSSPGPVAQCRCWTTRIKCHLRVTEGRISGLFISARPPQLQRTGRARKGTRTVTSSHVYTVGGTVLSEYQWARHSDSEPGKGRVQDNPWK